MPLRTGRWLALLLLRLRGQAASDECSLTDGLAKVVCIGASITKGNVHIKGEVASSKPYPQQLGEFLGPKYCVANLGIPGTTVLKRSRNPYWKYSATIKRIMAMRPDVVVMQFGANDSKEKNVGADFQDDYVAFVKLFLRAPSRPAVYIMAAPPIFSLTERGSHIYGMDAHIVNALQMPFEGVARETRIAPPVSVFDVFRHHCPDLRSECGWMAPDGVHPNVHGDEMIARLVYSAIMGDNRCFMAYSDREDCGFQHITEAQCLERGCCYKPSAMDGTPWCFNASRVAQAPKEDCIATAEQKTECGPQELEEGECRARGCCWRESSLNGTPSCFYRVPSRWIQRAALSTSSTATTTRTTMSSTMTRTSVSTSATTATTTATVSSTTSTTGISTATTSTTSSSRAATSTTGSSTATASTTGTSSATASTTGSSTTTASTTGTSTVTASSTVTATTTDTSTTGSSTATTTSTTGSSTTTASTTSTSTTTTPRTSTPTTTTTSSTASTTSSTHTTATTRTSTTTPPAFIIREFETRVAREDKVDVAPYLLALLAGGMVVFLACHAVVRCCGAVRRRCPETPLPDKSPIGGLEDGKELLGERWGTGRSAPMRDERTPLMAAAASATCSSAIVASGVGSPRWPSSSRSLPILGSVAGAAPEVGPVEMALELETPSGP